MENQPARRQIAKKVSILTLLSGEFIRQEGWNPNYILTPDNQRVSRVNIISVIVEHNDTTLTIDDGHRITLRTFSKDLDLSKFARGQCVQVIGRPREFNSERYIIPEIIKVVDIAWLKYRKAELKLTTPDLTKAKHLTPKKIMSTKLSLTQENHETSQVTYVSTSKEESESQGESQVEKIYNLIKELDTGDGVSVEDISAKSGIKNAEDIINKLLKEGEVFEIRPGQLKVLE